jgi:hypothetical protein
LVKSALFVVINGTAWFPKTIALGAGSGLTYLLPYPSLAANYLLYVDLKFVYGCYLKS